MNNSPGKLILQAVAEDALMHDQIIGVGAQTGDPHLHDPPILVGPCRRFPHGIEPPILATLGLPDGAIPILFGPIRIPQHVALNTVGVAEECVGSFVVAIGIEHDTDEVVIEDPVAVGEGSTETADLRIVADEGDI